MAPVHRNVRTGFMIRHSARTLALALALAVSAASLSGCAVAVGGAAVVGGAAAEERGLRGNANDIAIEVKLKDKYAEERLKLLTAIGVEVYEGRVLLTGATTEQALSDKAVALAWQVDGVVTVINEIQTIETGAADFAHDAWITTQLRSRITFDKDILSINYAIETVNRVVYLIGIAQSQTEVNKVIAHASNIDYVTKVVNHVRIKQASVPAA
jgi:osmotically-inducible protein OsmY